MATKQVERNGPHLVYINECDYALCSDTYERGMPPEWHRIRWMHHGPSGELFLEFCCMAHVVSFFDLQLG